MYEIIKETMSDYRTRIIVRPKNEPNNMLAIWYCENLEQVQKCYKEAQGFIEDLGENNV